MKVVAKQGGTAEILRPCNINLLQGRILFCVKLRKSGEETLYRTPGLRKETAL